jgi:hypothetical protein
LNDPVFCHVWFLEEVEGDLDEQFYERLGENDEGYSLPDEEVVARFNSFEVSISTTCCFGVPALSSTLSIQKIC